MRTTLTMFTSAFGFLVFGCVMEGSEGWMNALKTATRNRFSVSIHAHISSDEEPDLWDYFDPTLSPHQYPGGISPEFGKPAASSPPDRRTYRDPLRQSPPESLDVVDNKDGEDVQSFSLVNEDDEVDLFDYFDPLLSPHAYPDGISPSNVPKQIHAAAAKPTMEPFSGTRDWLPKNAPSLEPESAAVANQQQDEEQELDILDVFDPLKSPHEYPNGIPSTTRKKVSRVGILLVDHGSRVAASNKRLQQLARHFQTTVHASNVIVRAAHMEIASPTIPEELEYLAKQGVDEIVCHPFFLSQGRHVQEDIPKILDEAARSLDIQIPIVTTNHVGSRTDMMIRAIHSVVEESSALFRKVQSD